MDALLSVKGSCHFVVADVWSCPRCNPPIGYTVFAPLRLRISFCLFITIWAPILAYIEFDALFTSAKGSFTFCCCRCLDLARDAIHHPGHVVTRSTTIAQLVFFLVFIWRQALAYTVASFPLLFHGNDRKVHFAGTALGLGDAVSFSPPVFCSCIANDFLKLCILKLRCFFACRPCTFADPIPIDVVGCCAASFEDWSASCRIFACLVASISASRGFHLSRLDLLYQVLHIAPIILL